MRLSLHLRGGTRLTVVLILLGFVVANAVGVVLYERSRGRSVGELVSRRLGGPVSPEEEQSWRERRAYAVRCIEKGDYAEAVKVLSELLAEGKGFGNEPELLRVAKDLQERHSRVSADGGSALESRPTAAAWSRTELDPADLDGGAAGVGGAGGGEVAATDAGPTGTIYVRSTSLTGEVYVEGRLIGPPPVEVSGLPVGTVTIELKVGDEVRKRRVVRIAAGRQTPVLLR